MSEYNAMGEFEYPAINGYNNTAWGSQNNGENQGFYEGDITLLAPLDSEVSWFKKYWRPAIAWQYFAVCLFDFIIAPSLLMVFFYYTKQDYQQWQPLTLMGGAFYHMAMGAIIGVTAYGRSQEKIKGVE